MRSFNNFNVAEQAMKINQKQTMTNRGVTLIEALVVLSVMAFAVSLFAPLVVASRQEMRQAECANNLRRIGDGWLGHENSLGHLPSSGWGWRWTGDPDRGFGRSQPGGWAFDAIRFTEYENVANLGGGEIDDADKAAGMLRANGTPIPIFYCPDRRAVRTYPTVRNAFLANNLRECQTDPVCQVARIDYQGNSGNVSLGETAGPSGDRSTTGPPRQEGKFRISNGVTTQVSETRFGQITDGLSHTMMIGEKYLNASNYQNGLDAADDNSHFAAIDRDINGYTSSSIRSVSVPEFLPRQDRIGLGLNWAFGSAHSGGMNAAFCDNSVRTVSYEVDFRVFFLMGGRNDGPIPFESDSE